MIEIRRSPEKQQVLADCYGIDQSQVSRIKARLTWRDVPDPEMSTDPDPSRLQDGAGAREQTNDQAQAVASISKLAA